MKAQQYHFAFEEYADISELAPKDAELLRAARAATEHAYAPYSNFHVAAVARMTNGDTVAGTNQENASYPVGICAERTLLSTISSLYPDHKTEIDTMAISYHNHNGASSHPITPCGICRQTMVEYEARMLHPIRLIMGGQEGKIYVVERAGMLLPLSFTSDDM
ncbi:cytidine deaminase [Deminuibacter soli]|uniref:Cytidine deaminase n=1 Tax=Deminuibacter soli TaxID=2291815 RepID=A0A3E1NGV5_9BACT|nr:cytidine deaminase [Deminuibacter soli]RFM27186.1 cytidine deaminase [Deminuibacter soli]